MTAIDYANKVVLAPMVRVGTLPFRLTALEYGADLVWTEELVDKRIIGSVRKFNHATGAIEYWKGDSLTFSTNEQEKGRVILQLGTADPDLALQAALTVKQDVAGIDVNCGCPKKFSIQGGMGAALLSTPDKLKKILTNLVQNVGLPVTCKIRLLKTKEETVELVKMIESTGVKALTVHCRTRDERPTTKAHWDDLKAITEVVKTIPVIVNGDVYSLDDAHRAKEVTNASSVMIARGAQYNASVFRKEGRLSHDEVVRNYVKKCVDLDNVYQNVKYVILSMNPDPKYTRSEEYRKMQQAKSLLAICTLLGLESYYHETKALQQKRLEAANPTLTDENSVLGEKRKRSDDETECSEAKNAESDQLKKSKTEQVVS